MTFTYSYKDYTGKLISDVKHRMHTDENIETVLQEFRKFLLAAGFTSYSVDKYIEAE